MSHCCGSIRRPSGSSDLPPGILGGFLQADAGLLWVPSTWALPISVTEADRGGVLTITGEGATSFEPLYQRKMLQAFGARQVSTSQIWLAPWVFDSAANTQVGNNGGLIPMFKGRVHSMRVRHSSVVASADDLIYTLVLNGITDTTLTTTLNTNVAAGSNLADIVQVTALDVMNIRVDGATATRAVRSSVQLILEF